VAQRGHQKKIGDTSESGAKNVRGKNSQRGVGEMEVHHLVDIDATSGGRASHNEFMSMTIISLVVKINSKDFNVARIRGSVNRQRN